MTCVLFSELWLASLNSPHQQKQQFASNLPPLPKLKKNNKKRPYSKPKVTVAHSFYGCITLRPLKMSLKLTLCPCLEEALTLSMDFKTKLLVDGGWEGGEGG